MQEGAWGKGRGDELGAEEERAGYERPGVVSRWAGRLCVWDCPMLTLNTQKTGVDCSPSSGDL